MPQKEPAARLRLKSENVDETIVTPSIKFSHKGKRPVMIITLGLGKKETATVRDFTYHVDDATIVENEEEKIKFRDAVHKDEFFEKGSFRISFTQAGTDSTNMMITATLKTKVPGTGAKLMQKGISKAAKKSKSRKKR